MNEDEITLRIQLRKQKAREIIEGLRLLDSPMVRSFAPVFETELRPVREQMVSQSRPPSVWEGKRIPDVLIVPVTHGRDLKYHCGGGRRRRRR